MLKLSLPALNSHICEAFTKKWIKISYALVAVPVNIQSSNNRQSYRGHLLGNLLLVLKLGNSKPKNQIFIYTRLISF